MATTPTAAFSITLDCRLDNVPGTLGKLCTAIGEAGGNIGALDGFDVRGPELRRCLVVHCRDEAHQLKVVEAVQALKGVTLVDWWDRTFRMHESGKIRTEAAMPINDRDDLSMAYTPGVARVCMAIHDDAQVVHNAVFVERDHPMAGRVREPRPAPRFSTTPAAVSRPAPRFGEHSDEIATELGFDAAALRSAGVIH